MAIIPITQYGDKILRQKTRKIERVDDELIENIQDMFRTMRNANGIGLAGNQVGLNKSLFVIDLREVDEYEKSKPVTMINPEIILMSDELAVMEEGCLSLPGLNAEIARPEKIKVRFINANEQEEEIEAADLFARVILHEYDHLIGKMIPDRVDEKVREKLQKQLQDIAERNVEIDYPITKK